MGGSASCCHPFSFPCATILVLCCTVATAVVVSRAVMSHRRFACCWFRVTRFASWGCSFGVPLYSAPCCVFEVVLDSGRAARSESRTQCYSSRIVSRLGLFVRRYSSHLLLYSFGPTCFARVSSVILRIAGCRSECGEALRPQEEGLTTTPATMTTVEGRAPPSVTFPAVLPPSVEGIPIKGGTITPPHSANPSTHRYPRHSGPSPTPITPATPSTHEPAH